MISITTSESALQNFKSVIEYARDNYKDTNIHTEMLESMNLDSYLVAEGFVSGENDLINEATDVTDAKIIHDGKGTAISVKINGKEYRYVSATKSTPELYRSFMGQLKHAKAGYQALNWLKKNAMEYYGSKNPSEEGKKLLGLSESEESVKLEATQPGDIPPKDTDEEINESVNQEVINTSKAGMSYYDDFLNKKDHDYKRLVKGLQGEIVYMAPMEYIRRLGTDIFKCSTDRVLRGVDQNNVDEIAAKMTAGTKYNIPVLDLANRTQEGRHRALAAEKLGVKKIPVLVVTKWDAHKELGMPKCMDLWYGHTIQWTKKDGSRTEVHVGLDLEKVRDKVQEIVKSGDYKK